MTANDIIRRALRQLAIGTRGETLNDEEYADGLESLNGLIRVTNRVGRGYSFEAIRAKMLYANGIHRVRRPRYQRLFARPARGGVCEGPDPYQEGPETNYGAELSTLAERLTDDAL